MAKNDKLLFYVMQGDKKTKSVTIPGWCPVGKRVYD